MTYDPEYDKAYREANRERTKENQRAFRKRNPGYHTKYKSRTKRWVENNPEKVKAVRIVARAIRDGVLVRQPCEVCGLSGKWENGGSKVHAHHDDYNRPLDVRWLCYIHHKEHHLHLK